MSAVHPSWEAGADVPRVLDVLPPATTTWADEDVPSAFEEPAGFPAGRVPTPSGRTLSAAAARRIRLATPYNTRRGRESRTALFTAWCRDHGRVPTDPGTVPDYLAHLADRGHQPETLETYAGTLAHGLALGGSPLDAEDRSYISAIVNHRSAELAADPDGAGDALQATECTREDLAAMLATLDRSTVAGQQTSAPSPSTGTWPDAPASRAPSTSGTSSRRRRRSSTSTPANCSSCPRWWSPSAGPRPTRTAG